MSKTDQNTITGEQIARRIAQLLDDKKGVEIVALDVPDTLVGSLLGRGFTKQRTERLANLEDVFIDLTGHELRED